MISEAVHRRVLLYEIPCADWSAVYHDVKNVSINASCLVKIGNASPHDKHTFGALEAVSVQKSIITQSGGSC